MYSDTFVPIDTEAISDERLADLQKMADAARKEHGDIDAIVSTDGYVLRLPSMMAPRSNGLNKAIPIDR